MEAQKRKSNSTLSSVEIKKFKSSLQSQHSSGKKEDHVITDINVERYVESRAVEIQGLVNKLKNVVGNPQAFQKLPNHMRRRAMSHNIKRIPRRLRKANQNEIQKSKGPSKRPCRKYRRRPSNLLSEYERRKRRIGWLETHIWHAKRFKMVEKWGYKVANNPNDKSIRACYRACNKHCMMQDVSFESYIELVGPREEILNGLSHLTSTETGPTFAARMTASGTIQGSLVLYSFDSYPHRCIGQVSYMWRPSIESMSQDSTLWICCHPSFYVEVLSHLKKCFGVDENEKETNRAKDGFRQKNVNINSLKNQLVKFRLFGPASNAVLSEVLIPASVQSSSQTCDALSVKSMGDSKDMKAENEELTWWKEYYKKEIARDELKKQIGVWSQLGQHKSPAEAPPDCIIALTVKDPRLLLPPKRHKVLSAVPGYSPTPLPLESLTPVVSNSPLWEAAVRENVKATKVLEKDLNHFRSKMLVPGSPLELGDKESRIPILLIQRPGAPSRSSSTQAGYSSGWDILLPTGWSMAFWIALVYRGARVGGLREAGSICLQANLLSNPCDYLDSQAGQVELKSQLEALQTKHDRRPPAKRPNYIKLGVPFPFEFKIDSLVKQWSDKVVEVCQSLKLTLCPYKEGHFEDNVCTLRDRKLLRLLDNISSNPKKFFHSSLSIRDKDRWVSSHKNEVSSIFSDLRSFPVGEKLLKNYLPSVVPVFFHMLIRGVPFFRGHVCIPSTHDLKMLDADKNYGGPFEIPHKDPGSTLRKAVRKECLKLKKKKRKERKAESEISQVDLAVTAAQALKWIDPSVQKATPTVTKKENNNQIGKDFDAVSHTERPIIGFVRNGDFDLGQGQGSGLAFCSLGGLLHIIEEQKNRTKITVLIRNLTSLQFRFATFNIVL